MNEQQILDEIMKGVLNVPQNVGYSETIKYQTKVLQEGQALLKKELMKMYNKGHEEGIKYQKTQQIKKQQDQN